MQLPVKDYYGLDEVARRWGLALKDVRYYAEQGILEAQVWLNQSIYRLYSKTRPLNIESMENMTVGSYSLCGYVIVEPTEVRRIFANAESDMPQSCLVSPSALQVTRNEMERFELTYKVVAVEEIDQARIRSFGGRPTTMYRITSEMKARHARGQLRPTLSEEAKALFAWAQSAITDMQLPTVKSIIEGQRELYRELKQTNTQSLAPETN